MHVSEAVIDRLVANGVDTVFGIPGKQTLPLNESIGERDDIRFVVSRHETAVSHQAWGYAETSGRTAATFVVPGPGDMNAMNGLKNALNDCTPMVHFAVETEPEIRGGDGIHETPPDTYDNVVKENILVERPESAAAVVERAIAVAETAPKGPVRVGIPKNFLKMDVAVASPGTYRRTPPMTANEESIASAVDVLAAADQPVIVAGGGVRGADATPDLRSVAEQLDAPVVTTYKGKGVLPEDHELSAGVLCGGSSPDLFNLLEDADTALAVATDFDAVGTRNWTVPMPDELVHVTIDENDLGTGYDPSVSVIADAKDALAAIDTELGMRDVSTAGDGATRANNVRTADRSRMQPLRATDETPISSVAALDPIRDVLPRDAIVAADAGGFRIWTLVSFPAYGPRSYVNPGSWATMGTGLPSAIGAQLANPDEDVVALTGDGGLMMCVHELHTLAAEDLPVVVVVFNNSDYAIISEEADRTHGLGEGAYDWKGAPISFTAVAEGMGVNAMHAETPAEISDAVERALDANEPTLIEVPTDPQEPQASEWMSN